jgi:SAM-dependent methyltransferase
VNGKVRKADLKEYRRFEPVEYKLRHGQPLTAEDLVVLRARPDFLAGPALSQFWTPPHVAASIVDLLNVQRGDRVLEPGCGWGAFIEPLAADGASVVGIEFGMEVYQAAHALWTDQPNVEIHQAHLYQAYLNGAWGPEAHAAPRAAHADCVADETYDLVVGNSPYGLTLSADAADGDPLREPLTCVTNAGTALSEAAFVEIALRVLKPGGWLALILPCPIYGNHEGRSWGKAAPKVRPLLDRYWVEHVIRLPETTFAPATSIRTDLWIVCKQPGPGPYCVSEVENIGLDSRGRRTQEGPDDLAIIASGYRLVRDPVVTVVSEEPPALLLPHVAEPVASESPTMVVDPPPLAPLQLTLPGTPASYTQLALW